MIQDLDPSTEYIVQVSATNGAGTIQSSAARVPLFVNGIIIHGGGIGRIKGTKW